MLKELNRKGAQEERKQLPKKEVAERYDLHSAPLSECPFCFECPSVMMAGLTHPLKDGASRYVGNQARALGTVLALACLGAVLGLLAHSVADAVLSAGSAAALYARPSDRLVSRPSRQPPGTPRPLLAQTESHLAAWGAPPQVPARRDLHKAGERGARAQPPPLMPLDHRGWTLWVLSFACAGISLGLLWMRFSLDGAGREGSESWAIAATTGETGDGGKEDPPTDQMMIQVGSGNTNVNMNLRLPSPRRRPSQAPSVSEPRASLSLSIGDRNQGVHLAINQIPIKAPGLESSPPMPGTPSVSSYPYSTLDPRPGSDAGPEPGPQPTPSASPSSSPGSSGSPTSASKPASTSGAVDGPGAGSSPQADAGTDGTASSRGGPGSGGGTGSASPETDPDPSPGPSQDPAPSTDGTGWFFFSQESLKPQSTDETPTTEDLKPQPTDEPPPVKDL